MSPTRRTWLEWQEQDQTRCHPVNKSTLLLGRGEEADLCLSSLSVSRTHARLRHEDDTFWIEDLGSTLGTQLNGMHLIPEEPRRIQPGDHLVLGRVEMRLLDDRETLASRPTEELRLSFSELRLSEELMQFKETVLQQIQGLGVSPAKQSSLSSAFDEGLHRLAQYFESKLKESLILQEITQVIGKILDIHQLLTTVLNLVSKVLDADRGFILLHDKISGELRSMVTRHFDTSQQGHSPAKDITFSHTLADACFNSRQIILIEDALEHEAFRSAESIVATRIRSVVCIPLVQADEVSGVIYLDNLRRTNCFHEHQVEFLETFARQTAIAIENARLYTQAVTDELTGLYNRRFMELRLQEEMVRAQRYERPCSLILCDIDHFKAVNDQYGHQSGDRVLETVAELMRHMARQADLVARFGGEEFLMLLPETHAQGARSFAERLRKTIAKSHIERNGQVISITASFGVAEYREDYALDRSRFIEAADRALYQAKQTGRNRVVLSTPAECP